MTEVPEHLLRRSRERKAALGGEAPPASSEGDGGESGAGGGGGGGAVEPAAAAAAPARAAAPAPPTFTGPPQPPPRKQRVPMWAMPVLAALPFWALLYTGSFGDRPTLGGAETPLELGSSVYRSAGCSTCHGAAGGGGTGPGLGEVVRTFPDFDDHVAWVANGSEAVRGQPYGALGRIATGGMPGFASQLSPQEILAVVCHERVAFGKEEAPPQCEARAEGEGEGSETAPASGEGGQAGDQTGGGEADSPDGGGDVNETDTDDRTRTDPGAGPENANDPADDHG